ncbi:MAG: hypothetical protein ACYTGN_08220 [Planctomycetota bacterium]
MKPALILLALAGAAAAEGSMVRTFGKSLDAFAANLDSTQIRLESPKAVAETYARFVLARNDSALTVVGLVRQAHMKVLDRYFHPDLVAAQKRHYRTMGAPTLECKVLSVDGATAVVQRLWTDSSGVNGQQKQKLTMKQVGRDWRIVKIVVEDKDGKYVDRGLGVPIPPVRKVSVPRPQTPGRMEPRTTVRSMMNEMVRISALNRRCVNRLLHLHTLIASDLMGAAEVKAEQAELDREKPAPEFELSGKEAEVEGVIRVFVVATEAVPGEEERSAIGTRGFALTRATNTGEWWIVGELSRPSPDKPPVLIKEGFGMFFLG